VESFDTAFICKKAQKSFRQWIVHDDFFVSSDVTAEDHLVRALCNATLSANGW
jgi:hypothetical protein